MWIFLGKTIQTISLLCYLMEFKNNMGPFLIVVPLSTMSNWANEFNKWAPDIIKVLYKGTPEERRRIYKEEVENMSLNVLITTYEYIMRDKTNLKRLFWQYIIVDEGHRMKNADSKFAQTLGTIYQSKHRILLTGTPLQNNLPELWALLNFLLPKIFSSMETFDQWFNKPFVAFRNQGNVVSEENSDQGTTLTQEERLLVIHRLHEVLRPFVLRRVKDQVLDQLPEKVEKVLRCPLSGWQRHMYSTITSRVVNAKEGVGLNNPVMQLRKICNHPYLFLTNYIVDDNIVRMSGKFELLDRMLPKLQAAGHRVLMFSQMVEAMKCLESFFQLKNFQYLTLDGSTPADEREKRMYEFNDPNSPFFIFLLSTRAGGLGLNLATADTVIIFDR
jgi:SNF2 family DNA or RNA helicase